MKTLKEASSVRRGLETIKETENTGFTLGKTFYKKNILVVNSLESKKAAVFNTAGHFNDSLCFIYGDKTTASESCSVTFKNKFYIFGGAFRTYGNNEQTQLSVLNGNQLTRIDNLRFNLKDRFLRFLSRSTSIEIIKKFGAFISVQSQIPYYLNNCHLPYPIFVI